MKPADLANIGQVAMLLTCEKQGQKVFFLLIRILKKTPVWLIWLNKLRIKKNKFF